MHYSGLLQRGLGYSQLELFAGHNRFKWEIILNTHYERKLRFGSDYPWSSYRTLNIQQLKYLSLKPPGKKTVDGKWGDVLISEQSVSE